MHTFAAFSGMRGSTKLLIQHIKGTCPNSVRGFGRRGKTVPDDSAAPPGGKRQKVNIPLIIPKDNDN